MEAASNRCPANTISVSLIYAHVSNLIDRNVSLGPLSPPSYVIGQKVSSWLGSMNLEAVVWNSLTCFRFSCPLAKADDAEWDVRLLPARFRRFLWQLVSLQPRVNHQLLPRVNGVPFLLHVLNLETRNMSVGTLTMPPFAHDKRSRHNYCTSEAASSRFPNTRFPFLLHVRY